MTSLPSAVGQDPWTVRRSAVWILIAAGSGALRPAAPPASWHDALHQRGRLVALFGSAVDLGAADRGERIDSAAAGGGVVGAQLPVTVTALDTEQSQPACRRRRAAPAYVAG